MSPKAAIVILVLIVVTGGLFVFYLSVVGRDVPAGLELSDFQVKPEISPEPEKVEPIRLTASSTEAEREQAIREAEAFAEKMKSPDSPVYRTDTERQQAIREAEAFAEEMKRSDLGDTVGN